MMKHLSTRLLVSVFAVSCVAIGLSGCSLQKSQDSQPPPQQQNNPAVPANVIEQLDTQEIRPITTEYSYTASYSGQIALELLKLNAQVQTKESSFGTFIEGINGKLGDEKQYWAFYVNREFAKQGAGATKLEKGDTATFRLEPVDSFPTQASEK